jgi:flagellar basal body-associated protein FliL
MSAKPAAVEEVSEEAPKKSGNMLMIVLIVLVVVLIAAVGFLAFMMMNQNHGDKPAEHAEAPAAEPYKPEIKLKLIHRALSSFLHLLLVPSHNILI